MASLCLPVSNLCPVGGKPRTHKLSVSSTFRLHLCVTEDVSAIYSSDSEDSSMSDDDRKAKRLQKAKQLHDSDSDEVSHSVNVLIN